MDACMQSIKIAQEISSHKKEELSRRLGQQQAFCDLEMHTIEQ